MTEEAVSFLDNLGTEGQTGWQNYMTTPEASIGSGMCPPTHIQLSKQVPWAVSEV